MNGLQALPLWDSFMKHPKGAWLGWVNAIYWLGTGVVSLVAGTISNSYGRKISLYFGYALLVIGTTIQTAAPNPIAFMMARLFLGGATGFFGNVAPLIINEISYPTHRSICSALFMCGFYVGGKFSDQKCVVVRMVSNFWGQDLLRPGLHSVHSISTTLGPGDCLQFYSFSFHCWPFQASTWSQKVLGT